MNFTMAGSAAALFNVARCAITTVAILASSASVALADAPLPNHPETGAVAGQAGTNGGAATYTIPIEVPPGRAGMQPSLSFNYNSRAGDGVMGLGWSIGGLSAIHRCPQTPEQDNHTHGVSYSTGANGDRLCLDGQRLVPSPSSTDYGTLGMTYATEIDSHARITQAGGDLSAAATCFKVEERSGRILHYGAVVTGSSCSSSGSARVQPNGAAAPLSWLLVKVEDRAGNSEAYSYDASAGYGEVLLQSVIYTTGIIAGDRKVLFNYEPRTSASSSASDIGSSALDGGMSMQTKALLSVVTSVNNATARTYTPVYAAATYSHRLLMTGMQECAGSGSQGACHTTTQFGYNDGALDFQFTSLAALGLPTPVQGGVETLQFSMVGDLNGDGAREAAATVYQSDGNHVYMLQLTPDRHVQSKIDLTGTNFQLSPTLTADIDGSGRSSLVDLPLSTGNITFGLWNFAAFPRGQVATSNPFVTINSNIPYSTTVLPHGQSQRVFVADIDGDGKIDIVVVNPTGQCGPADGIGPQDGVFVYLNGIAGALAAGSSASFVPLNSGAPLFCLPRTTASTSSGLVYAEATIDHISDFDGNGLPDFFLVNSSTGGASVGSNDFAGVAMTQLSNSGTGSAPISSCTAIGLVSDTTPGNFNDECHWSSGYVTHWMDINGDGLEDFVIARPGQKQWQVRMNLGSGHLAAMIAPAASGYVGLDTDAAGQFRYATKLPIMDVDGDGKMDLLVPSTTQGAAGHGFAMKMCTMHGIAPQSNTECVVPSSGNSLSDVRPTAPDAVGCPTYFCPENPGTSLLDLPPDGNPGPDKQWNHHEAVGSYTKGGAVDLSAYYLAMLKFVQTGPGTMRIDLIETPAIARLKDSIGHTDDMFGDGLQDVVSSLGCVNTQATGVYPITGQAWSFQYCNAVNDNTYGPMNLPAPAGTATSTLATQVLPYASINQGVATVGGSPGAPAVPRLPTPAIAQGPYGTQLPLTTPFLPGLMSAAQNGVGDFASWGFFPLSVPAVVNGGAFYSVACSDPSHCGYADSHNYYFASSMPAVYGMGQNNGSGGSVGFRSAYYSYSEAIYNHFGRGFQGFRTITSNSYDAGAATPRDVRTTTTYKQKFPLAGKVESIVSMSPAGTVFERETDHWTCSLSNRAACPQDSTVTGTCSYAGPNTNVPAANTVYSPVLDSDCIEHFDLGTGTAVNHSFTFNAVSQTTSASGWDANGNLLKQNVTSADDGAAFADSQFVASHVVNTANNYLVDTTNWWLNKLNSSSVTTSIAYVTSRPLPAVAAAPPRTVTSSYIWNTDRTLSSSTRHTGTSNQDMVTSYSYPASGSVGLPTGVTVSGSGITQPRTTQFTYSKDGATQANDGYFVLTTMNALGQVTTTKHAPGDGQVTTTVDPNGVSTVNSYDSFGHLVRIDYLASDQTTLAPSAYVSWSPCAYFAGGPCATGYGEGGNQIAAAWRVTRVQSGEPTAADWYDALGRRVKHVESAFSGTFVEQFTNYDEMNTIASQSTPFNFVTSGGQYALTQWTYDRLGRPLTKKAPGAELDPTHGNVQTAYSYAGGRTSIKVYASLSGMSCSDTNTLCMNMTRSYDVLGRLERTVQGKGATSSYATTDYWYDPIGSVVASKDAESNISTASFDDVGHRSRLVDIDGGTWSFGFDALGEITSQTDARNVATTTLYDGLGRMTQRSSTNNPLTAQNISAIQDTWHYDPVGANGRLAYVQRFAGATTASLAQIWKESYAYEPATTRLSSITSSLQGQTDWTTSLTYDGNGREETVTYPSHLTVRDSYTPSGALSGLSNDADGTAYWSGLDADERGTITSELYFGTLSGNHETDYASGQVLNKSWATGSSPLDEWTYAYDSFANVTGQARSLYGGTTSSETYAYDGMQRLSRAARSNASGNLPVVAYGYTPSGNLDSKSDFSSSTAGSYAYGAGTCGPHAATGVSTPTGSLSYTCDANGNVTGGNTLSGNYDFNNQPWSLTRAGSGGGSAQFLYSADGQIFEQQTPSDTTWFGAHGYEVSLSGGQTVMRHELGPVVVVRQGTTDTSMAVLRDRLGSQVMLASGGAGGGGSGPPTPTISFNPPVSLDGHYAVNWTSSTGATSYTLRQQVSGGAATTVYTGAATTWSPTAANPVGTYAYSVQACAGTVCSNFSTPVAIEVEPAPPTSISAAPNPSTTGIYTVTWGASVGAQTYTLDEQVNHAGPWTVVSSANATLTWTTPIARTAGTYSYRVHACLTQCGNPGTAVNEVVSASTTVPLPPTGLTATPYPSTTGSFTVSWQAATNATYYVLQEQAGGNWSTGLVLSGLSSTFSNYSSGTYLYRVQACNTHGCSAFSATFTEVVSLTNAPGVPPTFATAPNPSLDGNFTASWGAVSGTGLLYQLEKSSAGTSTYTVVSLQAGTSWPITGQPEGDYAYRVKACRSGICGAYALYPESVHLTPVVPTGVVVTPNPSTGAFTVSWTASPTATYYYVFESQNGGAPSQINPDQVQHALSLALTRGNGTYAYQIEACKASPTGGDRCSAKSVITVAGTETIQGSAIPPRPGTISVSPTTCTVTAGHTCGVSISWGSSTGAQSYQLHEHIEDVNHDSDYTYAPIAGATQGIGFTRGLAWGQNPTVYEYTVRACAGSGASLVCSEYRGPATFTVNGPNNQIDRPTIVGTAYDAFGRARNGDMSDIANGKLGELPTTLRGFTGHVHEDDLWLIHMGGRVYDYQLGRFLSVDPVIQSPANSQSLNPYSYILNNPLSGRDPTGYAQQPEGDSTDEMSLADKIDGFKTVYSVSGTSGSGQNNGRMGQATTVTAASALDATASSNAGATNSAGAPVKPPTTGEDDTDLGLMSPQNFYPWDPAYRGGTRSDAIQPSTLLGIDAPIGDLANYLNSVRNEGFFSKAAGVGLLGLAVDAVTLGKGAGIAGALEKTVAAGDAGRFGDLAAAAIKGDKLTPHHMPQAAAGFTTRAEGGALVLPEAEHVLTRTYGFRGAITAQAESGMAFRDVLARDVWDVRKIGGSRYNQGTQDLLNYYRTSFPDLMKK